METPIRIEVLRTERLRLRPFVPTDAERLTELLQSPEIARWTLSIPHPYRLEDAVSFLEKRRTADEERTDFGWGIEVTATCELIGAVGLKDPNWQFGRAEIGYWIGESYWGKGYATEAAHRVVRWAFESGGLYRVQATYAPGNQRSAKVLRNVGMQPEGLLRGYTQKNGQRLDLELCAVLRTDPMWSAVRGRSQTG